MGKKLIILFYFFTLFFQISAKNTASKKTFPQTAFCIDLGTVQDLVFSKKNSQQFNADLRFKIFDTFHLRIPVNFTMTESNSMIDFGIDLIAYPFENSGFFAGMSMVKMAYQLNETPLENRLIALNELISGWTFTIFEKFLIEISVAIRDPSATFTNEYEQIYSLYPCYKSFRIHFTVGYIFI